ncbi:MAG: hypothetical protein M1828_006692 [Chrysothrix sp. TS-e1954]|nr:MAG: hypothetical protein M1828_006692 [Chrysothrix sp. TS-e1954]
MGASPSTPSITVNPTINSTEVQIASSSTSEQSLQPSSDASSQTTAKSTPPHLQPIYKTPTSKPVVSTAFNIRSQRPFPLNAAQESEVRDLYYKRVRDACAPEIKAFAHCCAGRTFSISWRCRGERKGMEECMIKRATREEEDAAREEWFARIPERKKEREELEGWKEGQRRMKREWWKEWEEGKKGVSRSDGG